MDFMETHGECVKWIEKLKVCSVVEFTDGDVTCQAY
jgi:hypothetical protein